VYDIIWDRLKHFIGFGFLNLFDSIVWDLNLKRMFKFKSKNPFSISLLDRQPTQPGPARFLSSPFLPLFSRTRASPREPAQHRGPVRPREPSRRLPSFRPGQLTGGSHPSAFPSTSAALSLPARFSPRRHSPPLRDRTSNRLPPSFSSFFPAAAPAPSRHLAAARACRRSAIAQRNRPPLFPRASAAHAALTRAAAARCPPRGRGTDAGHRRLRCPGPCRKP
jgi:hypothetical protein